MKKALLLLSMTLILFSCGQKSAEEKKRDEIIQNTDEDIHKIEKHYERVQKLVDAGLSKEEAEKQVNALEKEGQNTLDTVNKK